MKVLKFLFAALLIFTASSVFAFGGDKDVSAAIESSKKATIEAMEKNGVTFTKSQMNEIDELYEKALDQLEEKMSNNGGETPSKDVILSTCNDVKMKVIQDVLTSSQQKSVRSKR